MRILRATLASFAGLGIAGALSVSLFAGGQTTMGRDKTHSMPMGKMMTKEQKIADAMTAAPKAVSEKATVLDWPSKEGEKPAVLREGTNGWTCLPDMPDTEGSDPMCIDQSWMKWVDAYMTRTTPQTTTVGIGYMLAPGGAWASNTDPFAMAKTADNQWHFVGPHLMITVPDTKTLDGLPTDPTSGGPYVMFKGTPYAHIMAPTATAMTATKGTK